MIRLYRMLMRPYAAGLGAVLVLIFLQTIATLYLPTLMADIVNNGIAKRNIGYIEDTGKVMVVISVGAVICAMIAAFVSARIAVAFGRDARGQIFRRVQTFSQHEMDR